MAQSSQTACHRLHPQAGVMDASRSHPEQGRGSGFRELVLLQAAGGAEAEGVFVEPDAWAGVGRRGFLEVTRSKQEVCFSHCLLRA